jgi:hypothetical protein
MRPTRVLFDGWADLSQDSALPEEVLALAVATGPRGSPEQAPQGSIDHG